MKSALAEGFLFFTYIFYIAPKYVEEDRNFRDNCKGNRSYGPKYNKACSQFQTVHDLNIAIAVSC